MLGLVGGVKVVFTAKVCEGSLLSELYCFALYGDGQWRSGGLLRVGLVVGEFVCPEFACGQV